MPVYTGIKISYSYSYSFITPSLTSSSLSETSDPTASPLKNLFSEGTGKASPVREWWESRQNIFFPGPLKIFAWAAVKPNFRSSRRIYSIHMQTLLSNDFGYCPFKTQDSSSEGREDMVYLQGWAIALFGKERIALFFAKKSEKRAKERFALFALFRSF